MSWARHVALIKENRNVCSILVGKPEGKSNLEGLDINGRVMLKWIWHSMGKINQLLWTQ
jgi:hypothetical protein